MLYTLKDKHFFLLLGIFVFCVLFYYFGELVDYFGWEHLRWYIFYAVHDLHRLCFLVPIIYAGVCYRLRGAIAATIVSFFLLLPRSLFIFPYWDQTLRMLGFVLLAGAIGIFTARIYNANDKLKELGDKLQQAHDKLKIKVEERTAELSEISRQLKESREYLSKINNSMPDVLFTVSLPDRTINYVNDSVRKVFGYEPAECVGKTTEFLYPSAGEYRNFGGKIERVLAEGKDVLYVENPLRRKNGEIFPAEITTTFFNDEHDNIHVISIIRDITRRKQAEDGLLLSTTRLAEAQRIAHLGNWDWNITTNELVWSDEIYRIFGSSPQQFGATYNDFLNFVHPEDREFVEKSVDDALHKGNPYNIDHRIILPDKSVRVVHEVGEVTFDEVGRPVRMIGTVYDITERKRAEDELRALSHELVDLQENERRTFGRELHDEIGQSLTALQLLLNRIARLAADDIKDELNQAQSHVVGLMKRVREMSVGLYPTMLDSLGLLPALTWQFDRFTKLTQVYVSFEHTGLKKKFAPEITLATYRIIQEALTNVARHASVDEVTVTVSVDRNVIHVRVEDRGKGFSLNTLDVRNSSGLSGMRERALALGGTLVVDTSPGIGTRIMAELPLSGISKRKRVSYG